MKAVGEDRDRPGEISQGDLGERYREIEDENAV
jgi:hypothetical protein